MVSTRNNGSIGSMGSMGSKIFNVCDCDGGAS